MRDFQLNAADVKRIRERRGCSMQEAKSQHIQEILLEYMEHEFQGLYQVQQVLEVIINNMEFNEV